MAGELHAAVLDAAAAVAPLELETATDEWLRRRGAGVATTDAHCSIEVADAAVWMDGQFECCDLDCVCMVWRRGMDSDLRARCRTTGTVQMSRCRSCSRIIAPILLLLAMGRPTDGTARRDAARRAGRGTVARRDHRAVPAQDASGVAGRHSNPVHLTSATLSPPTLCRCRERCIGSASQRARPPVCYSV